MKKIILVIILLFILFLSFFTVNSEFRRKIMTYVFVTHDYYQLKTVTSDIQKRDFTTASNKLMKYINISKKLAKDSSYMTGGIYKAVETVINRAILQDDFNKLEKVLAELVKIEPNSYKPNVWLARAYSDNKLEESLVLLEKAIALSPSQEDAYRELLRISQFHNIKKTIKKYCNSYSNSQLSGLRSSTYASLFNSNNLRRFAMSINDNNFFYTNDGIVLNQIQNYEFVLNSKTNINNINLFFSLLPGIKLEIKKVELLSNNEKFLIPNNKTFITSRNSYFINDDDKISIFFTNLSDEIIRINFNENFYNNNKILFNNVEKINLVMEFNKLNLSNITLCSN